MRSSRHQVSLLAGGFLAVVALEAKGTAFS